MHYDHDRQAFYCDPYEANLLGGKNEWGILFASHLCSRIVALSTTTVDPTGLTYVEFSRAVHDLNARQRHMAEVVSEALGPLIVQQAETYLAEQSAGN